MFTGMCPPLHQQQTSVSKTRTSTPRTPINPSKSAPAKVPLPACENFPGSLNMLRKLMKNSNTLEVFNADKYKKYKKLHEERLPARLFIVLCST
jgi:hypothetical protein